MSKIRLENKEVPDWIKPLLGTIADSCKFEQRCGPIGCVWQLPDDDVWHLLVYPTAIEVIESGPDDGAHLIPGFTLSLGPVIQLFREVSKLLLYFPAEFTGDLDGPGLIIEGVFSDKRVKLSILDQPPEAAAPTVVLDRIKNEMRRVVPLQPSEEDD